VKDFNLVFSVLFHTLFEKAKLLKNFTLAFKENKDGITSGVINKGDDIEAASNRSNFHLSP